MRLGRTLTYLVLIVWTFICVFPVLWVYIQSFKPSEEVYQIPPTFVFEPTSENYQAVLGVEGEATTGVSQSELPKQLVNSTIVAVSSISLSLVIGVMAAYPLARMRMRGRALIMTSVMATRLVPPVVIVLPLYVMWQTFGLTDTHVGLILAYLTITLPFNIWLLRGFFLDIPLELEDAALTDGCSRVGALVKIILPLSGPGIATAGIFTLINVWNEFMLAMMLTSNSARTLPPGITSFITETTIYWGRIYAAAGLTLLPVVVFTLFLQKYIVRGLTGGAVKGG